MNKPMNLKDLPAYLNNGGDDVVVDMGMIIEKPNWTKRIAFASVACVLLVAGVVVFNSSEEVTIVVNSSAASAAISTMIQDNGGEVIEVENNTYKVRLNKFRSVASFLEKLKSNKIVESAELESK